MKNKLLAGIFAILVLAALAGCDSGSTGPEGPQGPVGPQGPEGPSGPQGPSVPTLDWGKTADYDSSLGDLVLGTATAALDGTNGRYQETVLGNFIMDGLAEYARYVSGENINFAMHNGQNLRVPEGGGLAAGNLTNNDILPRISGSDTVYVCTYTGAQIEAIINNFVNSSNGSGSPGSNRNCAVMVSKEVKYEITPDTDTSLPPKATNITVNGVALLSDNEYRVAVGSFIGTNAAYPVASKKNNYSTPINRALAMYVLAKGTINPADYPLGRYTGEVPLIP
jgi:2',3'-cyclic-nucleotide 2'-phosphodiesterase (5'-nucleotidase family)